MRVKGVVVECANPAPRPGSWMRLYPALLFVYYRQHPALLCRCPAGCATEIRRPPRWPPLSWSMYACMHDPLCSCSLPTPSLLARCFCLTTINTQGACVRTYVCAPPRPLFSWLAPQSSSIHSSQSCRDELTGLSDGGLPACMVCWSD
jgi:hypothetical protein